MSGGSCGLKDDSASGLMADPLSMIERCRIRLPELSDQPAVPTSKDAL